MAERPTASHDEIPTSGRLMVLSGAAPTLWLVFGLKLLAILAYGIMNSTLVLWLSADLGYSDTRAGSLIAVWSSMLSLCTVLVGSFTDAVGLRRALLLGFGICVVARAVMTFAPAGSIALPFGLLPLAFGEALLTPVMVVAVKRYTTTRQRSMAFSIFYVAMNLGFAGAGFVFDGVRGALGEHGAYTVPLLGLRLSTYRTLFLLSTLTTLAGLLVLGLVLRGPDRRHGEPPRPSLSDGPSTGTLRAFVDASRDVLGETGRIFAGLWRQPAFYRFLAFLTLVVGVRLIFYHMFYTFPKYAIRELGPGAPIGQLFGVLNSTLIILFVPLVGVLTQRASAYRMVTLGSLIAASSVFFIAVPPEIYAPLAQGPFGRLIGHAWLGLEGAVHPLYVGIVLFVFFLSLGEALWSPRLYEYTAAIAPEGQEGSYMALSVLPFFIAKFFVGMLSGFLLTTYCPEAGPRDCREMWLIIGAMALITPIGLIAFRRFLETGQARFL
ncbi:MAG: MFS transporter [Gammaproteobacteria bacterium]